jgi:hypothetical protein
LGTEFHRDLGESATEIITTIGIVSNVSVGAPPPDWPSERIAAERSRVNQMVCEKTGFTYDQIMARMRQWERNLNVKPSPVVAGTELGMKRLLRKSEERRRVKIPCLQDCTRTGIIR